MRSRLPLLTLPHRSFSTAKSSIDPEEVQKFSKAAQQWWNPSGEFGLLHRMNPIRTQFVRDFLTNQQALIKSTSIPSKPFRGLKMLDVGCGGGILSESLARLGATVTAIDASSENVGIAQAHASMDPEFTKNPIDYQCITAGNGY